MKKEERPQLVIYIKVVRYMRVILAYNLGGYEADIPDEGIGL